MARKKKHDEEPENSERWLLTYSDLITLLLGLFVILYAMSQVDKTKYQDFVSALTQKFGSKTVLAGHKGIMQQPAPKVGRAQAAKNAAKSLNNNKKKQIAAVLAVILSKQIASGQVVIRETKEGVSISLLEKLLFDTGKAIIRPEGLDTLDHISSYLLSVKNPIRIEGHTDNVPINTPQFPSNWHLSVARSMNTGYYVLQKGLTPERLAIAGYSEYRPIAPNDTAENRAQNRRVEIVILTETPAQESASLPSDSATVSTSIVPEVK
jgi:chemotaxis protein MotB